MANSKLHIICGNCGSNDDLMFRIVKDGHDITTFANEPEFEPAVFITCRNCSTLHDLSDTIDVEKE